MNTSPLKPNSSVSISNHLIDVASPIHEKNKVELKGQEALDNLHTDQEKPPRLFSAQKFLSSLVSQVANKVNILLKDRPIMDFAKGDFKEGLTSATGNLARALAEIKNFISPPKPNVPDFTDKIIEVRNHVLKELGKPEDTPFDEKLMKEIIEMPNKSNLLKGNLSDLFTKIEIYARRERAPLPKTRAREIEILISFTKSYSTMEYHAKATKLLNESHSPGFPEVRGKDFDKSLGEYLRQVGNNPELRATQQANYDQLDQIRKDLEAKHLFTSTTTI